MKKERIYPPEVLWVKEHQEMLNIYQLEKQVGMSMNLLRDFLNGTWGLHERWWEPVIAWVRAFTKMPVGGTAAPQTAKSGPTKRPATPPVIKKGSSGKGAAKKEAPGKAPKQAQTKTAPVSRTSDYLEQRRKLKS